MTTIVPLELWKQNGVNYNPSPHPYDPLFRNSIDPFSPSSTLFIWSFENACDKFKLKNGYSQQEFNQRCRAFNFKVFLLRTLFQNQL